MKADPILSLLVALLLPIQSPLPSNHYAFFRSCSTPDPISFIVDKGKFQTISKKRAWISTIDAKANMLGLVHDIFHALSVYISEPGIVLWRCRKIDTLRL